jgi:ubiquinone/menaquinone biosynthesis C-methylase UbiE
VSKQLAGSFDRVAADYDRTRGGEERAERFAARLTELVGTGGVVLDIGAGTGILTSAMWRRGVRLYGVDIAWQMLRLAASRVGGRVVQTSAERLPFGNSQFTAAYAVWVLHHVEDQVAIFMEAARVLEPGGQFLVVTTNRRPREDDISRLVDPVLIRLRPNRHGRDDPDRLQAVGEAAGFTLTKRQTFVDELFGETPDVAADRIESRSISMLWDLTQDEWQREIVPLLVALRGLEEPERPRQVRAEGSILVFQKPVQTG